MTRVALPLIVLVLLGCAGEQGGDAPADGGGGTGAGGAGAGGAGSGGSGTGGGGGSGCGPVQAEVRANLPYSTIAGVDPTFLSLDVHAPALADGCATVPIVIWVHGGAWAIGDKANAMDDKVALVNGAGWILVSVNYRLSPSEPSGDPARVMHPLHAQDVATAVHWVKEHAGEFHGDPARLALLGHSAGAHLVALLSTDESFLAAHGDPLASVRCTGSFDTEAYDIPTTLATASALQRGILENAFGTDPAVQVAASPGSHVVAGKGIPPFLIVVRGSADRQATELAFADALTAAGVPADTIDARSLTHEEVNDHLGAPGDTIMTPPVLEFLHGCLD